jgi:hypothetical protein
MINQDFYPTPPEVIEMMVGHLDIEGKTFYEPEAGKGDIVDYLLSKGANVLFSEIEPKLQKTIDPRARFVGADMLGIKSDIISHVDYIVMNPPFSADTEHILHALDIAPPNCQVVALCNYETLSNDYSRERRTLKYNISQFGNYANIGNVFKDAERKTPIDIGLINLFKPAAHNETNYDDYFDMTEEEVNNTEGIIKYSEIRAVVNRYVGALKLYKETLSNAVKMDELTKGFSVGNLTFTCSVERVETNYNTFQKELQKNAWKHIFGMFDMDRYITKGVKEDINKFVETQTNVPFKMDNIYKMVELIAGTHEGRMKDVLIEASDKITSHYHDNRYTVEGWKSNSHHMVNKKIILPHITSFSSHGGMSINWVCGQSERIEDLIKAICYVMGENYKDKTTLHDRINNQYIQDEDHYLNNTAARRKYGIWYDELAQKHSEITTKKTREEYVLSQLQGDAKNKKDKLPVELGKWIDWDFFEIRGYKKGTMHFKFKDMKVWERFNRAVAEAKGFPLPEAI